MTKTDELKTKRERIIHNEREKFRASYVGNFSLAAGIGLFVGTSYALLFRPDMTRYLDLSYIFLAIGTGLVILGLFNGLWRLGQLVDPDDLPKPKRSRKPKK